MKITIKTTIITTIITLNPVIPWTRHSRCSRVSRVCLFDFFLPTAVMIESTTSVAWRRSLATTRNLFLSQIDIWLQVQKTTSHWNRLLRTDEHWAPSPSSCASTWWQHTTSQALTQALTQAQHALKPARTAQNTQASTGTTYSLQTPITSQDTR